MGVEVLLHVFLTAALEGGEWSASRLGALLPVPNEHEHVWVPAPSVYTNCTILARRSDLLRGNWVLIQPYKLLRKKVHFKAYFLCLLG